MTAPLPLTEIVSLRICPACNASGCRACNGTGRVPVDPYRIGGGEQGDDFSDAFDRAFAHRERLLELARVLRGPENSAPLTELLDLVEAAHG